MSTLSTMSSPADGAGQLTGGNSVADTNATTTVTATVAGDEFSREVQHDIAVVIGVAGILLNSTLLLLLFRNKKVLSYAASASSASRSIIINQCAQDFIVSIFLIWAQFHSIYFGDTLPEAVTGDADPKTYCTLIWSTYLMWGMINASTLNLQVLTIERYLSLCNPAAHRRVFSRLATLVPLLVLPWLLGPAYEAVIIMPNIAYEDNRCVYIPPDPNAKLAANIGYFLIFYLLPIVLMSTCYGRCIMVLRRSMSGVSSAEEGHEARYQRQVWRFTITCVMVCVAFAACYSCNSWYIVIATALHGNIDTTSAFYHASVVLTFINCFVNPVVYFVRIRALRQEFTALLGFRGSRSAAESDVNGGGRQMMYTCNTSVNEQES